MEPKANHVIVGVFVLSLIALLTLFIVWLAKFYDSADYVTYYTRFSGSVSQLRKESTVSYGGIPVGKVLDVRIDPENSELARVDFTVLADTPIRVDTRATQELQSITGSVALNLSRGAKSAALLPPGSEVLSSKSAIEKLTRDMPDLIAKLQKISENVDALLSPENQAAFHASLESLQRILGNLADNNENISRLIADTDKAMKSLQDTNGSFGQAARSTDKSMQALARASAELQALLAENREPVRQFTGMTLYDAAALIADLRRLTQSMTRITEKLERDPAHFLFGDRNQGVRAR